MKMKLLFGALTLVAALLFSGTSHAQTDFTIFNVSNTPLVGTVFNGNDDCSSMSAAPLATIPALGSTVFTAGARPNQVMYVEDACGNAGASRAGCIYPAGNSFFVGCNGTYQVFWINESLGWIFGP